MQRDVSTSPGHHYVDQAAWSLEAATPVTARAGDVLVFSYLLVHGSYPNTSDRCRHTLYTWHTLYTRGVMPMLYRERRMFLIQVAAGEDTPASAVHRCGLGPRNLSIL